ncbi:MAG TPA: PaaI family thioesterase [Ramlibacter sp.]|nr:PaaI family thioesterase [Ramlibacter sp.]
MSAGVDEVRPVAGAGRSAVMTLLDRAMADAARSHFNAAADVSAVDLHFAFMRPATGELAVTARTTGGGRSVCFCEASIIDAAGQVAAHAMGTFRR